jgi:hypothetical protein
VPSYLLAPHQPLASSLAFNTAHAASTSGSL